MDGVAGRAELAGQRLSQTAASFSWQWGALWAGTAALLLAVVLGIAQALADRYGTAGTLAVHTTDREGDQRNHHAHILMTTRRLEPSARWARRSASWTT